MGANSSIFLHPALPADDETVSAFQEFENECISRNLKANEIYDLLNEKYDHLLGRELEKQLSEMTSSDSCSTISSPLPPIQTIDVATQTNKIYKKTRKASVGHKNKSVESSLPSLRSTGTAASPARRLLPPLKDSNASHRPSTSNSSSPQIAPRKPSLPKTVGRTFGSLTKPRLLPSLQSVSCDAAIDCSPMPPKQAQQSNKSPRQPPCVEVERSASSDSMTVTDTFDETRVSMCHTLEEMDPLTDDDQEEDDDDATVPLPRIYCSEDAASVSRNRRFSLANEHELPTLSHFECRLCKKKFGSSELLETHIAFSQTHKQAVQRIRGKYRRAFEDADKVGVLLRKATERFQRSLQTKKDFKDGKISTEKMRWQRAIGKVVSQFTAKQIEKIMQTLQEEEEYERAAVAAADHTAPPQAGVLMFTSSRFFWRTKSRFNVYVLYHKHCHTLEVISVLMPEKPTNFNFNSTNSNFNNSSSSSSSSSSGKYSSAKTQEDKGVKVSPRIFLSMDTLETQYSLWQDTAASVSASSGVAVTSANAAGGVISAEDTGTTRAMRIVRDVVQSLKIDFVSVQQGTKSAENALFYDDSMAQLKQLPSPLLTQKPATLILSPIEPYLKLDTDEEKIQAKLNEVSQAQQLLIQAVDNAEKMALKIHLRPSPRQRPLLLSPLAMAKAVFSPANKRHPAKFAFDEI